MCTVHLGRVSRRVSLQSVVDITVAWYPAQSTNAICELGRPVSSQRHHFTTAILLASAEVNSFRLPDSIALRTEQAGHGGLIKAAVAHLSMQHPMLQYQRHRFRRPDPRPLAAVYSH